MKVELKKTIKILFILLLVLIAILVVLVINQKKEPEGVNTPLGSYEIEFTEKSINTENFDQVLNDLPIPSIDMRSKIQNFVIEFLKHVYPTGEYNEEELKKYYETNQVAIEEYLYECNFENFKLLSDKMKEIDENSLKYTGSTFYPETLKYENNEYKVNLQIVYNNNYELDFIVHLEVENNSKITFEILK